MVARATIYRHDVDDPNPTLFFSLSIRSTYLSERAWRHLVLLRHPLRHAPAVVDPVLGEALPARRREEAAEQQEVDLADEVDGDRVDDEVLGRFGHDQEETARDPHLLRARVVRVNLP